MLRDLADEWLLAHDTGSVSLADCRHDPRCRSELAHYEREMGVMLTGGPAENRTRYTEVPGGLMGPDDLARAATFVRTATPERAKKRRRARTQRRSVLPDSQAA